MKGYIAGCTELIENRFLQNKTLSERPLHCLDPSRGIFLYNDKETGWMKNAPVDLNSVITNVDTKFNEFNRDYQQEAPIDNQTREMKIKNKEEDPIIYYHISNRLNEFLPPKYKKEEDKDSEHEKFKKKIIKNISVKCAFNKPSNKDIP
jgi:restriction endonuclease Mrr